MKSIRFDNYFIISNFSLNLIVKLRGCSKYYHKYLTNIYNKLIERVNIYYWSRAHTAYITIWGDGIPYLSTYLSDFKQLTNYSEYVNQTNILKYNLSEYDQTYDKFIDKIYDYIENIERVTDKECDIKIIYGKYSGEQQVISQPIIQKHNKY